jgi:hypothetical protein
MFSTAKETRMSVGETAGPVGDGYASLRMNRTYELTVEHRDDRAVAIVLNNHEHDSPKVGPTVITEKQYSKWFKK